MKLIGKDKIAQFSRKHSRARKPLEMWVHKTENAIWENSADVKATFPTVDNPGDFCIFNISGNKYRLVALVAIKNDLVIVNRIMTHAEYDEWNKRR
jgi:mRNA interferase HigB